MAAVRSCSCLCQERGGKQSDGHNVTSTRADARDGLRRIGTAGLAVGRTVGQRQVIL